MQTAVSVKAGVAFLAGVALALGSAYTYFKVAEPHTVPTAHPAVKVAESAPPSKLPEAITPVAETPEPAPEVVATDPAPANPAPRVIHHKLILPKPTPTSRPVSLALSSPVTQYPQSVPPLQTPPPQDPLPTQSALPAQSSAPPPVEAPPAPSQPHTVIIPEGTSLAVRVNEKLSTDHNYSGDTFRATLEAPLVVDGFIIADRGSKVLGQIVKAQKPGKMQGAAELSLTLTEISTTDGQRVHVETNQSLRKGPSNASDEAMKMGGGAALGAIIGAIAGGGKGAAIGLGAGGAAGTGAVLLGRGKPAVIDSETRLTFQLANPTTITEHLN